jgi:hypothetical protein
MPSWIVARSDEVSTWLMIGLPSAPRGAAWLNSTWVYSTARLESPVRMAGAPTRIPSNSSG